MDEAGEWKLAKTLETDSLGDEGLSLTGTLRPFCEAAISQLLRL